MWNSFWLLYGRKTVSKRVSDLKQLTTVLSAGLGKRVTI
jgi:hypothetical protein